MPAQKLDGQQLAKTIRAEIAAAVAELLRKGQPPPGLATVLVGDNPASQLYVRNKHKACQAAGMRSFEHVLPGHTTQPQLLELIAKLNADPAINGILVQQPLPKQIDEGAVIRAISPLKDVDCFHPENVGLLAAGHPRFLPCTPYGIAQLLVRNGIELAGKHVVVVGRSNIVGKPLALMLMQKPSHDNPGAADATVTVVHSRSRDIPALTRQAEVLIAAVGRPRFVTADMVKPGAAVVDVGTTPLDGKVIGDVDPGVAEVAGWLSPVPGGVGPMTITMLLHNTLEAARMQSAVGSRQ
jgi:methylenetetrahydrofolate dehydrogenase (NADP+) / methenyltetrahydrofolate cyclohydrolase